MNEGWVEIFSSGSEIRAELLKQALAEAGVVSVVINQKDSSYLSFGDVQVYVQEENVEQAKLIVERFEN
jgi:hypothetical protein